MSSISYETPLGCFPSWELAAAACELVDLDPCLCISIVRGA